MQIKTAILNNFRNCILLLLLTVYVQLIHAQANDPVPATDTDLGRILKQLLREQLASPFHDERADLDSAKNSLKKMLKDSVAMNGAGQGRLTKVHPIPNTIAGTGHDIVMAALKMPAELLHHRLPTMMHTPDLQGLLSQLMALANQSWLQWKGGTARLSGQAGSPLSGGTNVLRNNVTLLNNWSIMDIPLDMLFTRQDFSGPGNCSRNSLSFSFNREAYLNALRDKIKAKLKPPDLLPELEGLRTAAETSIREKLDSINAAYKGTLLKQLAALNNLTDTLRSEADGLDRKLSVAQLLRKTTEEKDRLLQLQQQLSKDGITNANLYDSLLNGLQSLPGMQTIIHMFNSFRNKARKIGPLGALQLRENELQQCLHDPDKLKSLASAQLDLNGLQKFFLSVSQFSVGYNTISLSPLTLYQYANNGFNAAFTNKRRYLFIMAARQAPMGAAGTNSLPGLPNAVNNTSIGIRLGKGDIDASHSHVSVFSYKQNGMNNNGAAINPVPGNTVVASFSNQLKLNGTNYLRVEISRSDHAYNNQADMYDTLARGNASKQIRRTADFAQQMACTLQWNGMLAEKGLTYDLSATSIGIGYTNPGNPFMTSGTTILHGSLGKSFLHNRMQASARADYRQYTGGNNTRWYSNNFNFQGKWKCKGGQYISFRYQPYQSARSQDNTNYHTGEGTRLSVDGNFHRRFGKIIYQQVISVGLLRSHYRFDSLPANSNDVLVSAMQAVIINKKSYYLNLQYSRAFASSGIGVSNPGLNADAGCAYRIFSGLSSTTAISYNTVPGWFRQLGVKQSISGQLGSHFTAILYTDIVKNISVYKPGYINNSRLDWSLQYLLK